MKWQGSVDIQWYIWSHVALNVQNESQMLHNFNSKENCLNYLDSYRAMKSVECGKLNGKKVIFAWRNI